jgi:hypothetical protein
MDAKMNNHLDESAGAIVGISTYILTHLFNFQRLQIPMHPITSEILIDCIRLVFTVSAAGIGYLVVHWLKKNVTHEEIKTQKKHKKE